MKCARMKWRRGQGRGKDDINMLIFIENCVWSGCSVARGGWNKNIGFHSVVSDTESCERSSCSNRVVHITALLWQMTVPKTTH